MAESELRRLSHLTQQSLSFYRESIVPIPVNIEETIDSVLSIYEKRIEAQNCRRMQSGNDRWHTVGLLNLAVRLRDFKARPQ